MSIELSESKRLLSEANIPFYHNLKGTLIIPSTLFSCAVHLKSYAEVLEFLKHHN